MAWPSVASHFQPQDGLRDIYVLNTTSADWGTAYHYFLRRYPHSFRRDGLEQEPPGNVEDILDATGDAAFLLTLHVAGLELNCHFFTVDEIELDLDPQEVNDENSLAAVTNFLLELGRLLGRRVILTAEDAQDAIILEYSLVDDDIRYPIRPS